MRADINELMGKHRLFPQSLCLGPFLYPLSLVRMRIVSLPTASFSAWLVYVCTHIVGGTSDCRYRIGARKHAASAKVTRPLSVFKKVYDIEKVCKHFLCRKLFLCKHDALNSTHPYQRTRPFHIYQPNNTMYRTSNAYHHVKTPTKNIRRPPQESLKK
jgi:hypothetical protein